MVTTTSGGTAAPWQAGLPEGVLARASTSATPHEEAAAAPVMACWPCCFDMLDRMFDVPGRCGPSAADVVRPRPRFALARMSPLQQSLADPHADVEAGPPDPEQMWTRMRPLQAGGVDMATTISPAKRPTAKQPPCHRAAIQVAFASPPLAPRRCVPEILSRCGPKSPDPGADAGP